MTPGSEQLAFPVTPSASITPAEPAGPTGRCEVSRWAVFADCPHCGAAMAPEHAHYRCTSCGWRDSCCD